ncbi:hypothetical protein NFJ02_10g02980 [Pycnococcus provasolii]
MEGQPRRRQLDVKPEALPTQCQLVGTPDVDANADPLVSMLKYRVWSVVEDCFDQQWKGYRLHQSSIHDAATRDGACPSSVCTGTGLHGAKCVLPVWSKERLAGGVTPKA